MKKTIALAALMAASLAAPAQAGDEVLTIVNRTGYEIAQVHIAPNATDDWEEDVLGSDLLENGETLRVDMSQSVDTCNWDLMVVYSDEDTAYWRNLDFCEMSRISLYYDAGEGKTWAETD